MKNYVLLSAFSLLLLLSCAGQGDGQEDATQGAAQGELRVNMVADQSVISKAQLADNKDLMVSSASFAQRVALREEPSLTPEMFTMKIEDPQGKLLKSWPFVDMPKPLKLNAGSYKMVATYGGDKLPAWDVPYYRGEAAFSIAKDQTSELDLVCRLAGVKVQVVFDDSFKVRYSAYALRVRTGAVDAEYLPFSPETHGKAAYFAAGPLRLLFVLTVGSDGRVLYHDAGLDINAAPGESYVLRVKATLIQGLEAITITTDESTIDKDPIDIFIPQS